MTKHGLIYQLYNNTALAGVEPMIMMMSKPADTGNLLSDDDDDSNEASIFADLGPYSSLRIQASVTPPSQTWVWLGLQTNGGCYVRLSMDHHPLLHQWASPALNGTMFADYELPVPFVPKNASLLQIELTWWEQVPTFLHLLLKKKTSDDDNNSTSRFPLTWLVPQISLAEQTYQSERQKQEQGWNTWLSSDLLTHVLLPHGVAVSFEFQRQLLSNGTITDTVSNIGSPHCDRIQFPVKHGLHAMRGTYTELEELNVGTDHTFHVETATYDTMGQVFVITPITPSWAKQDDDDTASSVVTVQLQFHLPKAYDPRYCEFRDPFVTAYCPGLDEIRVQGAHGSGSSLRAASRDESSTNLLVQMDLQSMNETEPFIMLAYAPKHDRVLTKEEALHVVHQGRLDLLESFGTDDHADTRAGLLSSISWNAIYTPFEGIITPVFRGSYWQVLNPNDYVLFEWDTYFASMIASFAGDVWVATNNIVRMTQSLWYGGYVAGYWNGVCGEMDKSKPPIGSLALEILVKRHSQTKWLIDLLLPLLMKWNSWWRQFRMQKGLITPGSSRYTTNLTFNCEDQPPVYAASCETGLDNSPLYDHASFVDEAGVLDQMDVGMSALYIRDCIAISRLAVGFSSEPTNRTKKISRDFDDLARRGNDVLNETLWNTETGIYINRKWTDMRWIPKDDQTNSFPIAPTSFYPLLTHAPKEDQVMHMMIRYLRNSSEFGVDPNITFGIPSISRSSAAFHDNDYWRGRIWAPMNFLVYLGLKEYAPQLPIVRETMKMLAQQSERTFLVEWTSNHRVMENFDVTTGRGCDGPPAQPFYHWGALNALIPLLQIEEERKVPHWTEID